MTEKCLWMSTFVNQSDEHDFVFCSELRRKKMVKKLFWSSITKPLGYQKHEKSHLNSCIEIVWIGKKSQSNPHYKSWVFYYSDWLSILLVQYKNVKNVFS